MWRCCGESNPDQEVDSLLSLPLDYNTLYGGYGRARTYDVHVNSVLLCLLSYITMNGEPGRSRTHNI